MVIQSANKLSQMLSSLNITDYSPNFLQALKTFCTEKIELDSVDLAGVAILINEFGKFEKHAENDL